MNGQRLKHGDRKGVVLIISVGVLALVAMIATSFAINMQVEYGASVNYLNSARATAIAQAGIDKVIADIRGWVAGSSYSTVLTNIDSYSTAETALGNGSYQITIGDTGYKREEQKININALDQTDSPWIDLLLGAGLTTADVGRLIDYRDWDTDETTQLLTATGVVNITGLGSNELNSKNALYATVDELRLVLNNDTKYDAIKNMITVYAPILKGGLIGRYYSDITFDKTSIFDLLNYNGKVIELGQIRQPLGSGAGPWGTVPGADGNNSGWDEGHDTSFAGGYIATSWSSGLFQLDKFGVIWTGFIYIPDAKAGQNITFQVRCQDGYRLIIDGTTLVEDWRERPEIPSWPGTAPSTATVSFACAGWHPIRIEFYNKTGLNLFELKWDALGASDYVPAAYLGYQPASYYGDIYDDVAQTYKTASTLGNAYNSAGIFKITSKGRVKRSDGTLLAEKQITTVLKVFNTWTQTTRPEFYAAWFSLYNNFSDGEIRNVTWLDSCPTDTDYPDTTQMHWEGSYAKVPDSLKLGFWDNFDDDVAFSVVNFKGGLQTTISGPPNLPPSTNWVNKSYGTPPKTYYVPQVGKFTYSDTAWNCSHAEFQNVEGANITRSLKFLVYPTDTYKAQYMERYAEVNGNFYAPSAALGYNIFVRAWTYDNGQKKINSDQWGYSASKRETNTFTVPEKSPANTPVYTAEWAEPHLCIKRPPWTPGPPASATTPAYMTMMKDGDDDIYYGDENELSVPGSDGNVAATYSMEYLDPDPLKHDKAIPYILAAVGVGTKYESFYSYQTTALGAATFTGAQSRTSSSSTDTGVVQLEYCNMYSVDNGFWDATAVQKIATRNGFPDTPLPLLYTNPTNFANPPPVWRGAEYPDPTDLVGGQPRIHIVEDCQYFDNVRIIYPKGYLVSTPCAAKLSTDNSTIKWGTVSWTADTPANTSITMYIRSADALATTDNFATTVTNGASLSANTGRNLQYKALLATTALTATATVPNAPNVTDYTNSSVTPVLRDITVTYLSPLETLYRK